LTEQWEIEEQIQLAGGVGFLAGGIHALVGIIPYIVEGGLEPGTESSYLTSFGLATLILSTVMYFSKSRILLVLLTVILLGHSLIVVGYQLIQIQAGERGYLLELLVVYAGFLFPFARALYSIVQTRR
jgi:hypothetical protein